MKNENKKMFKNIMICIAVSILFFIASAAKTYIVYGELNSEAKSFYEGMLIGLVIPATVTFVLKYYQKKMKDEEETEKENTKQKFDIEDYIDKYEDEEE